MATWVASDRRVAEWISRSAQPNVVAVLDVDDLHVLNNRVGHEHLDLVLVEMLTIAQRRLAGFGGIAVRAGDEYCLAAPATHESGLRQAIGEMRARGAEAGLTLSGGLAKGADLRVVADADNALMSAKLAGKDRLIDGRPERLLECALSGSEDLPLAPRSDIERRIMEDARWREGAAWGEPRSGHPEGAVVYHIMDVLRNIDRIEPPGPTRERLRLIALVHDTFKYQVDRSRSRLGQNEHAYLARAFAQTYLSDPQVLLVIGTHDDAYRAWRRIERGDDAGARERAEALIRQLADQQALSLYLAFYQADNTVPGKTRAHRDWFTEICRPQLESLQASPTHITPADGSRHRPTR